jgi:hypothetical protein
MSVCPPITNSSYRPPTSQWSIRFSTEVLTEDEEVTVFRLANQTPPTGNVIAILFTLRQRAASRIFAWFNPCAGEAESFALFQKDSKLASYIPTRKWTISHPSLGLQTPWHECVPIAKKGLKFNYSHYLIKGRLQ